MSLPPKYISVQELMRARHRLRGVALHTPLQRSARLSQQTGAEVYLKREDLQEVRSYKIRGSYNKMACLGEDELARGVVCASAGNHAQGVALSCAKMGVRGLVYMPVVTPPQKVSKVRLFGGDQVEVVLTGDTFDDAQTAARRVARERGMTFVHPFDDPATIAGQGTIGLEILDDAPGEVDLVVMAVGGGGLSAGVGSALQQLSPATRLVGIEPKGAPAMHASLAAGRIVTLDKIDSFVDGAAVRRVGEHTFPIVRDAVSDVLLVDEGKVCVTMLELYNEDGLIVEPAGCLPVAALDQLGDLRGQTVVLIIGGSNNDITRTAEIQERALLFAGLKHYFIITFPQRAGALRDFLQLLGPDDDISHFEYVKKHNRAKGPALVGIELARPEDFRPLVDRLTAAGIEHEHVNDRPLLYDLLI